jgi:hypothetical protein
MSSRTTKLSRSFGSASAIGGRDGAMVLGKRITTPRRETWTGRVGEDERITVVGEKGEAAMKAVAFR